MNYDMDPGEDVQVVGVSDKRPLSFDEIERKVVDDGARLRNAPKRSKAQEHRDAILDDAENMIRAGRDLVVEGMAIFAVLEPPQHQNLPTLLGQQIEQVIQHRRLRGND